MKLKFNISTVLRVICAVLLATQLFFVGSPDQASNIAIAQTIGPCVVQAGPLCTQDINPCGNASICECPRGYDYNEALGKCLIYEISQADGPGIPVKVNQCALDPESICTQDINQCGNASICICPEDTIYNPVVGLCLSDIDFY